MDYQDRDHHARATLARLWPDCGALIDKPQDRDVFASRLDDEFPRLVALLHQLYGHRYDFYYHLEQILANAARMFNSRPADLKALDREREANPLWFQAAQAVGAVCYVDLFADDLSTMVEKIPYFKELGITYLHLMPLFKVPEKNNDGGYAISDYRSVDPKIGTMQQLAALAADLRHEGISLVLDFVFNHTSDEHTWAQKALAGDATYQNYYYMFADRRMPDAYERTLREIFPEQAPGSFTYIPAIERWVWTSFYDFQWDLNYKNPEVFNAMAGEMLFLANQGVEVLRLDALAFIWKEMGTACESLPQAHVVIQAYNALVKIVAPAMLFKSEAIVHPDAVASYIGRDECPLSYNPTMMALLWESLATRKVSLLQTSMAKRFAIPDDCAWVNYVRVHDDIGWTFADEDASVLWINGYDHRRFLNSFYTGAFDGSFASGLPFGYNAKTGDMRISGTAASLAGLEQALESGDELLVEMALLRLHLIHSVIMSAGGIPLIYLGDEIAATNDYNYLDDPKKQVDSRWAHRQRHNWDAAKLRHDPETIQGRMYLGLKRMIEVRKSMPHFDAGSTTFFPTENEHVLGYIRNNAILCICNFSEHKQLVSADAIAAYASPGHTVQDLINDTTMNVGREIVLEPYQYTWLRF